MNALLASAPGGQPLIRPIVARVPRPGPCRRRQGKPKLRLAPALGLSPGKDRLAREANLNEVDAFLLVRDLQARDGRALMIVERDLDVLQRMAGLEGLRQGHVVAEGQFVAGPRRPG